MIEMLSRKPMSFEHHLTVNLGNIELRTLNAERTGLRRPLNCD
jgi:hypothetical protein